MKKLEHKVFYILVSMLSIFLLTFLIMFNVQSYNRERTNIENNLMRMGEQNKPGRKEKDNIDNKEMPDKEMNEEKIKDENQKIFMDSIIYTVQYDSNGNIVNIISHTENGSIDEEVENTAKNLISSNDNSKMVIGNLYFEKYSYTFKDFNQLIISDNSMAQTRLRNELNTSIILFILLEIVIIYFSKRLTSWIIKPAYESLEKQKQFIADASHELKTPIAVIMASSEALENDFQQKWIDNIKSESERMSKLINNLLNLSKIENNNDRVYYSKNNLSKIIENSCMTFESLIYEKQIKFVTNIEKEIYVKCDLDQIKQLMGILLDNAIKHSESKGEISINLRNQKNEAILEVINKGKDIPKEIQDKIFERFYRADESRNRDDNRFGLGLAIAKGIVINHEGKIEVNSNNGYTTFRVYLKKD